MTFQPLTPERWPDFVDLFTRKGPRGGNRNSIASGCWCMYWRDRTLEHGEPKRRAMAKVVRGGGEPGLLAYDDDGSAVGWVAIAPREDTPVLLRSPQYGPREQEDGVWAITCFVVDRPAQGRGVATALVDAAVEHAFARGARAVEAYPHATNGSDYMGGVELFRRAGFTTFRAANKRVIVRRER
jgi:ribosomal protein S18 acetylase RimI-like enzyme